MASVSLSLSSSVYKIVFQGDVLVTLKIRALYKRFIYDAREIDGHFVCDNVSV